MKKLEPIEYLKYFFLLVAILELVSRGMEWPAVSHVTKPMLMPILLVYLRKGTTGMLTLSFLFAAGALIFSFGGDSFLMFVDDNPMFFLLGLGSFAIAHVLYIISFTKAVDTKQEGMNTVQKIYYALPFVIFLLVMLKVLIPGVDAGLKVPVVIYMLIIVSMTLAAIYRNGRSAQKGVNQVIQGAILFILSDSLLAMNMFFFPMANAGFWVMLTYILAQWNIVNGLQKHYNEAV